MNIDSTATPDKAPENDTSGAEFMTHDPTTKNLVMKLFALKATIKSKTTSQLKKELAKKKYDKMLMSIVKGHK